MLGEIRMELRERLRDLDADGKLLESQRLEQRTLFDIEQLGADRPLRGYRKLLGIDRQSGGQPPVSSRLFSR